ncbi:sulfotransferase [Alkalilacustris brevis]|uniref:sulfotransferase n=1 Tax=Alkalilacustris brevis TaxID=2026338 RepID=UPI001EE4DCB4|nr:sulfotransferase [Alkalilacustris brevis]
MSQGAECFTLGQLELLWQAWESDAPCRCGANLRDCPVYGPLLDGMFSPSASGGLTPAAMRRRGAAFLNSADQVADWGDVEARAQLRAEHEGFLHPLAALLDATSETSGARVLVETSGDPRVALALDLLEGGDLRVLNLLRDPRAVACSSYRRAGGLAATWRELRRWRRRQQRLEQWRHGLGARYMALRYEDFTARPRDTLANVLQWAGLQMPAGLFSGPDKAALATEGLHFAIPADTGCTATQNGQVAITPHESWRVPRNAALRGLAVVATWPGLRRHYPPNMRATIGLPRD